MPPAIGAAVAAIGAAAAGTTIFGLSVFSSALLIGAANFAVSMLTSALTKAKTPNLSSFQSEASNRTQQLKQPITAHRHLYGYARVSGPLVFASSTDNNKYLHLVVVLAAHEVTEIGEVWLNDEAITDDMLDVDNIVTSGTFEGKVRIKKHLGTSTQTADADLVADVTEWTSDHRLRGMAYIYVRLEFDRDVFPTGIPNISAYVKGKKLYDTRSATTVFTANNALIAYDYLTSSRYGIGVDSSSVDSTSVNAAANVCDEYVTVTDINFSVASVANATDLITLTGDLLQLQLADRVRLTTTGTLPAGLATGTDYYVIPYQNQGTPRIKLASSLANCFAGTAVNFTDDGTGTITVIKKAEPRYHAAGVVETGSELGENFRDILSGMGGDATYIGGKWRILAAAYRSPSVTFTDKDLRGPLKLVSKVSMSEKFNIVKGVYVSPLNLGQPSDYPAFKGTTYITIDGEEKIKDYDLPMTPRPHTGQRLAKILLEKHRQEIVIEYPAKLSALKVQPGDTVYINNDILGFSNKIFEVMSWKLVVDESGESPMLGVDMILQETASAVYDWNNGEETSVDPAPNTTLPDVFFVSAPTTLAASTAYYYTQSQDPIPYILFSWAQHINAFVTQKGEFEIQYKKSLDPDWLPSFKVDGSQISAPIYGVESDVNYDVRIRAINNVGKQSTFSALTGFTIGAPSAGADTQYDYGFFNEGLNVYRDYLTFQTGVDPVTLELDYGDYL